MTMRHRRSLRLSQYDYTQTGMYFVTLCTKHRACLFGDIIEGRMMLNEYGDAVASTWKQLPQHCQNVSLDEFVVMPNHIHGIVIIDGARAASLKLCAD